MNENIYSYFKFSEKNNAILLYLNNDTVLTYSTIDKKVAQYCNFFKSINIKQGDRIALQSEKCVDSFCVYLASLRYGAVYIPLNPAFLHNELSYFIEDSKPSLFICAPEIATTIQQILIEKKITLNVETLSEVGSGSIQKKINEFDSTFNISIKSKDDIACILYTSGTTGKPKGAMLTHENLLSNGVTLKNYWGFTEKDTLLHILPLFHCHGLFFATHCVLLSNASMIFLSKFDVDNTLKYISQSTVLMGVPTHYTRLLSDNRFTKELTSKVRLFISGSAPLLEKTFFEFEQRTGKKILERYGMTETGINTSNPLIGDRISSTVGLSLPEQKIRIVDDNGIDLPTNSPGHIQVKGKNIFHGYWKKEDKDNNIFTKDGFFITGDIGKSDENGYISIIGRTKDMIITGGINVYPIEIENLINKIDGVKESIVIGLPHTDFGEAVTALIVSNEDSKISEKIIINWIKSKLANYKVPKKIIFVDQFQRNSMGKIQKNIYKEQYKDLYSPTYKTH